MGDIDKASFNAGYLIAVANIIHTHDETVIAEDVLRELQSSESAMRRLGLSDYDTKPLGRLFREIRRKDQLRRPKPLTTTAQPEGSSE